MDVARAMQVFSQVATLGSFSRAAERLALPAATVTHIVQELERELGVRLLHRTTRKVTLTDDGALYLERCTRLLADIDDAQSLFSGARTRPRGVVRVDLPERLARLSIIPALPDFFARYPDIQIRMAASDRFVDLVGEGVDCAVRVGPLADSSLVARRIGEMAQVNCAAPAYIARHGMPLTPADLPGHVAVNYFSTRAGRELPWEWVERGETRRVKMQSAMSVSSSDAYLAACLAGLGMVQVPRHGVEALLADGRLVEVLPAYRPAPLPVSVVYARNRQLSARVRVFVDWICEHGLAGAW
jgi:DNA-binding transcriptional LysR family regulator